MKKMNFTSITLRLMVALLAFVASVTTVNAQCPERITKFLSDPAACSATLTTGDLGGATNFTVKKPGFPASGAVTSWVFGKDDIGVEFEIMATGTAYPTGMCYTYATVADNLPPVKPADFTTAIRCTDLVNGKVPAPGTTSLSGVKMPQANAAVNVINTKDAVFTVSDCSAYYQYYDDVYGKVTPCPTGDYVTQTVTRTWIFKDKWGNASAPLVQTINIISAPLMIGSVVLNGSAPITSPTVLPATTSYDCNSSAALQPYLDWNLSTTYSGSSENVVFQQDYCGRSIDLVSEVTMPLCGGKMITRLYKVNNCGVFGYYSHVTTILDRTSPNVSFGFTDYLRVPTEICRDTMNGAMTIYRTLYNTVQESKSPSVSGFNSGETAPQMPAMTPITGSIKISPLMDVDGTCNTATISLTSKASDVSCTSGKVTYFADATSPLKFNGMPIMEVDGGASVTITGTYTSPGLPSADAVDYIYVKDQCGNITKIKITVVIIDNITPNSYCEDKQVSLTNNKGAVVTAKVFSSGKQDNCTSESKLIQYIRKTGTTCWKDQLVLGCGDNGKVDIITIDSCGNFNICCVNYETVDKVPATCLSPNDFSVPCTDSRLASVGSLFGTPTVYSNCAAPSVVVTDAATGVACGKGSFTRTWTYTQTNDAGTRTFACSQKITVTPVNGFRVKPLTDLNLTCGGYVYDEAAEKAAALAQVKLLDGTSATGAVTCSAPVVEVEKWEYSSSAFCKIIRIRYTFVDKCLPYCSDYFANENSYEHFNQLPYENTGAPYFVYSDGYQQAASCGNAGSLFYGFERFIMINDKTAPTSTVPVIAPICLGDNCTFAFPGVTLTGSDKCDDGSVTSSNLAYTWRIAGTNFSGTTAVIPSIGGFAAGSYTVNYTVSDLCGNINYYTFKFSGSDCKTPFILVHEKNLELGYDTGLKMGMGTACVDDMLNNLGDNCTGYAYLYSKTRLQRAADAATYSETLPTCLTFGCADKGLVVPIRVWTRDEAGNTNFVLNYITVQDNKGACQGALAAIKGSVSTENNQVVNNVTVSAAASTATTAAGAFEVNAVVGSTVQVKAVKLATEDKYAGVTTFDIARISKHLLDIEKFTSPYAMIAADVNKDGEIDGSDMLHIRNFILRKSTTLPGGVWRFIDKSYSFKNAANPFGEDFPEVINLSNVPASATANFTAVKLGDVNTTYTASLASVSVRNSKSLVLQAEDMQLKAGNEYTVNITADNFDAAAFQGTFSFNGATVKSVKAGDIANYNDGNFGVFGNEITTSWNGAGKLNANVMTITFVANKSGKLSEVLTVGSSLTPAVANDAQGSEMNVNLKFTTGKVSGSEFALYQNTPNPVSVETKVGFNLPSESTAKLTIYNVEGKVMMVKNGQYKAGYNEISINKSELNANGVMYYRLETPEHTATKKMIIIE